MTNIQEIWKPIPEHDRYEVSNLGRVRSSFRSPKLILKQSVRGRGYKAVALYITGTNRPKFISVHQLVAMAFLGHVRNGHKVVVDHIDLDKLNNSVDNLRLVSNRENCSNRKNDLKTSKYTGVSYIESRRKYQAKILDGKITRWLGYHNSEYDAHLAYQNELSNLKT